MEILPDKKFENKFKIILPWFLLVLSLLAIFYLYKKLDYINKNPNQVAQNEIQTIVDKVGKLMILPKDELPTVATITNLETLKETYKDVLFFANAKVGDKILIYIKSGVAILYDPIKNIIVESGPIKNIESKSIVK